MGRHKKNQDLQPEKIQPEILKAGEDFEYWKNRINECISSYEIDNGVSVRDIKKVQWNAVLIYIYNHVFKRAADPKTNSRKSIIKYSDIQFLNSLCDYYIYICLSNNKDVSVNGFSYMTGIPLSTLGKWKNSNTRNTIYIDSDTDTVIENNIVNRYRIAYPEHNIVEISNNDYSNISKKLYQAREHTLADLALDGSVMSLALGKIEYGWIEGKDKQLQADLLQQRINGTDLLTDYKNLYIATADTMKKSTAETETAAAAGSSADEPQDIV